MSLRERLRLLMDKKELAANALAEKADVNVNTLNTYLSYRETMPAADIACRLARALGVTVEYLIEGREPQASRKRDDGLGIAADSRAAGKGKKAPPGLSLRGLIMEEIKKTPRESLPALLELVLEFNKKHK